MNCFNELIKLYNTCGDFTAVTQDDCRLSLSALLSVSQAFSDKLAGKNTGSCAALCLPNSLEAIVAFYALCRLGINICIIHSGETAGTVKDIARDTGADFLITDSAGADKYSGIFSCVFNICDNMPDLSGISFSPADKSGDIYLCAGGTTGENKITVLSQDNICNIALHLSFLRQYLEYGKESTLLILPFSHSFGLAVCVHFCLTCGLNIVPLSSFSEEKVSNELLKHKVSFLAGVPAMFAKMLAFAHRYSPAAGNFRLLFCGGDFAGEKLLASFNDMVKKNGGSAVLYAGYGLTETASVCCVNTPENHRTGSVGRPLGGISVSAVDDNCILPRGASGEIAVSGDTVARGYLGEGEQPFFTDKNSKRWLLTGDTGYVDEDGYVFLTGRKKRMIVISGYNVFPAELEKTVCTADEVSECCAVEKNADGKPSILLYVSCGGLETEKTEEKIRHIVSKRLSKYYMPSDIIFLPSLPHTEMGKIDYNKLMKGIIK